MAVHDTLLRLIGDDEDARAALERTTAELEAFARIHAEADAEVNTGDAKLRLDELEQKLKQLDLTTSDPKIETDITGVLAQIAVIREQLDSLDREDVNIDINMRKDIFDRIQSLTSGTNSLSRAVKLAGTESLTLGQRIGGTAVSFGPFTSQLRTVAPLALAAAGAIVALVAAVGALVASLAEAVAGLGALAIAFGGVLLPAIGLVFVAFQRFKQQSGEAGTAAHALATAWSGVSGVFKTLLPAADPVLRALAQGLSGVGTLVRAIKPAFIDFGRAAGGAIRTLVDALSDPALVSGLVGIIQGAAGTLRPLAQIAGSIFRIFVNIANAAMPLLQGALSGAAGAIGQLASATSNVGVLRVVIAGLVSQLRDWLALIGQLSSIFLGFINAANGPGQELVQWLTKGASAIADWVNSADGQDRIKQFFADTLPLAQALITTIAKLAVILLEIGQFAAPILLPIVNGFNDLLDVLIAVLEVLNKIPAPIRGLVGVVGALLLSFTKIGGAARLVIAALVALAGIGTGVFHSLANAATSAFRAIPQAARTAFNAVKGAVAAGLHAAATVAKTLVRAMVADLRARWNIVKTVARIAFTAAAAVIRATMTAAKAVVSSTARAMVTAARAAWNAIKAVASSAFNAAKSVIQSTLSAAAGIVRSTTSQMKSTATAAWNAIKSSAASALGALKGIVSSAFQACAGAISAAGGALVSAARAVWNAVNAALPDITIDIHIPTPSIPHLGILGHASGTSFFEGGWSVVGETGPELVHMPTGTEITPAAKTKDILAGGGGGQQHFHVHGVPGTGQPDPHVAAARLALLIRQREDF